MPARSGVDRCYRGGLRGVRRKSPLPKKAKEPQRWGAEAIGTLRVLLTDKPAGTIQLYAHSTTTLAVRCYGFAEVTGGIVACEWQSTAHKW